MPTIDTVKSFAEYMQLCCTEVYQMCRAQGFPIIRTSPRGKILIKREAAIEWMEQLINK
jgi:hypothetical protein